MTHHNNEPAPFFFQKTLRKK